MPASILPIDKLSFAQFLKLLDSYNVAEVDVGHSSRTSTIIL